MFPARLLLVTALVLSGVPPSVAEEPGTQALSVAQFDGNGRLVVPRDLDQWIFLGSSLGMGYSQRDFDPDSPGMFQIVRIEPNAYRAFLETGHFVDGTLIALQFHGAERQVSINRAGFVMGESHGLEIHYKDSRRFPQGFNFYTVAPGESVANEVPLPNDCVTCHAQNGAYEGVFVQFYPDIQPHLPEEIRAALRGGASHAAEH